MRILVYNFGSYIHNDVISYFEKEKHQIDVFYHKPASRTCDPIFEDLLNDKLSKSSYDLLFSVNFFPLMAVAAYNRGIPYVSWSYDSPLSEELIKYFHYDTNIICLFDSHEVSIYNKMGFSNVYHIPLAVNCDRLDKSIAAVSDYKKYVCDFSFVGDLHISMLDSLIAPLSEYNKGFLEGLLNVQLDLYGADVVTPAISDEFIRSVNNDFKALGNTSSELTKTGLSYAVMKELTHIVRASLIEELGNFGSFNFYSYDKFNFESKVNCLGPVSYLDEMPAAFRHSKISLCPTLRSIVSGIPLRALDIMGSKGTLLINYQEELAGEYVDGEDCIIYSSLDEAIEKAIFYKDHDDLRKNIALSGYEKTKNIHSYDIMMGRIMELVKCKK